MLCASDLEQVTKELGGLQDFQSKPIYSSCGDFLVHFFENDQTWARRINSLFTVYLRRRDKRVIGYKIKGFKALLDRMGKFAIAIDEDVPTVTLLNVVDRALTAPEPEFDGDYLREAANELGGFADALRGVDAEKLCGASE